MFRLRQIQSLKLTTFKFNYMESYCINIYIFLNLEILVNVYKM